MVNPLNTPTSDDKLWAGLSYVGASCCAIPALVIFLLKRDESRFIKFHSLQALAFGLAMILLMIAFSILGQIPILNFLIGLIAFVLSLGLFGYWIYLIVQAFMGKDVRIPVLADFIDQNLMG